MLELRRLRLLRELHERGTIAAVADALQFTPSAVSQQLGMLEREAGVQLLERAGRGVRLTDAALVLTEHAEALLERAAVAEADLAAAAGTVAGRARVAGFQSVFLRVALPAMERLTRDAPRLRCELIEAEPEQSLPALALGDLDLVLGDEWPHHPIALPDGVDRHDLLHDAMNVLLPAAPSAARRRAGVARRARGRGVGDGRRGRGLGGDDDPHLPGARRLRPGRPPQQQRPDDRPGDRQPWAGGRACCPTCRCRRAPRAWPCARSPRAR